MHYRSLIDAHNSPSGNLGDKNYYVFYYGGKRLKKQEAIITSKLQRTSNFQWNATSLTGKIKGKIKMAESWQAQVRISLGERVS